MAPPVFICAATQVMMKSSIRVSGFVGYVNDCHQ